MQARKTVSGNPLNWPVVIHQEYLLNCLSYDTAYIMQDWPFGFQTRCIKRVWQEQALEHSQAKNWRLHGQTTRKSWNNTYTNSLNLVDHSDSEAVRKFESDFTIEYERIRLTNRGPYWNKADVSEYSLFACWELLECRPDTSCGKDAAMLSVRPFKLDINSTYPEMVLFLSRVTDYREKLLGSQIGSLRRVELICRKYNPNNWPSPIKWEAYGLPYA